MVVSHEEMFEILGLSEAQERIYRMLLAIEQAPLPEIIESTGLSRPEAKNALVELESQALIVRSADRSPKFSVSPADIAVQSLLFRRRQEIEEAGGALIELVHDVRADRTDPSELVELVRGEEAVAQWAHQLTVSARQEVISISKPPYAVIPDNGDMVETDLETDPETDDCLERSHLEAGVSYRVVYDITVFDLPGAFDRIAGDVAAGEEARVLTDLPMKLMISDRSVGLMALNLEEPDLRAALVVRSSPLLDALIVLFECLWDKATPFDPGAGGVTDLGSREAGLPDDDRRLVALLSTGMTDEAIAAQLGVTTRTLRRRLGRLSDEVSARTRFQLGLEAGWRGWVKGR